MAESLLDGWEDEVDALDFDALREEEPEPKVVWEGTGEPPPPEEGDSPELREELEQIQPEEPVEEESLEGWEDEVDALDFDAIREEGEGELAGWEEGMEDVDFGEESEAKESYPQEKLFSPSGWKKQLGRDLTPEEKTNVNTFGNPGGETEEHGEILWELGLGAVEEIVINTPQAVNWLGKNVSPAKMKSEIAKALRKYGNIEEGSLKDRFLAGVEGDLVASERSTAELETWRKKHMPEPTRGDEKIARRAGRGLGAAAVIAAPQTWAAKAGKVIQGTGRGARILRGMQEPYLQSATGAATKEAAAGLVGGTAAGGVRETLGEEFTEEHPWMSFAAEFAADIVAGSLGYRLTGAVDNLRVNTHNDVVNLIEGSPRVEKIAKEAAARYGVLEADAAADVVRARRSVRSFAKAWRSPRAKEEASVMLTDAAGEITPENLTRNLEPQNPYWMNEGGFGHTTAEQAHTVSADKSAGLSTLEKNLAASDPEFHAELSWRVSEQQKKFEKITKEIVEKSDHRGETATALKRAGTQLEDTLDDLMNVVEYKIQKTVSEAGAAEVTADEAAEMMSKAIDEFSGIALADVDDAYKAAGKFDAVQLDVKEFKASVTKLVDDLPAVHKDHVPVRLQKIIENYAPQESYAEIEALRQEINAQIRGARRSPERANEVRILEGLKYRLDETVFAPLEKIPTEGLRGTGLGHIRGPMKEKDIVSYNIAKIRKAAHEKYVEYAAIFRDTDAKRLRTGRKPVDGKPRVEQSRKLAHSRAMNAYTRYGKVDKQAAADLDEMFKAVEAAKGPNASDARRGFENWMVRKALEATDQGKSPKALGKWMQKNKDALDRFPGVKSTLDDLSSHADELTRQAVMNKALRVEVRRSALGAYIEGDPKLAIKRMFKSNNPEKALKQITDQIEGNVAARQGLGQEVWDHLWADTIRKEGAELTPNAIMNPGKIFRANKAVFKELYDVHDYKVTEEFVTLAETLLLSKPGATTRVQRPGRITLLGGLVDSFNMVVRKMPPYNILRGVEGSAPLASPKARVLLQEALVNPELAAELMRYVKPRQTRGRLGVYATSNESTDRLKELYEEYVLLPNEGESVWNDLRDNLRGRLGIEQ